MRKLNLPLIAIFLFWSCIIASTFILLIELPPKSGGWPYWDKVQHIVGFGVLTTLGCFAYTEKKVWLCLGLVIYGALIEYFQSTLTYTRMASLGDWLADVVGITIAVMVFVLVDKLCIKPAANLTPNSA